MHDPLLELFRELADVPPEEREKILTDRCVPADLRAELDALLAYDAHAEDFLARRVSEAAESLLGDLNKPWSRQCGAYHLVKLIGSGGMGSVYLAERRDGEIQQQAAIKLLRADSDRPEWRERFLRERQFLAYLNHPSIARLLDAGHTAEGLPYLVMEYVDGLSIDEYAARLDLRDQLKLFLLVCEGVSHAHQRLVIHRDLKPSNILVDSSGHPKLLDFGIAKLLDVAADETRTVERLLTPNYASPEQVRGEVQTTATDVYSLGAVLYKLVTGRSPREQSKESSSDQPITAEINITLPSRLNPKLPRDIDHILRKALRHEPEERYASVDAFADDVRAFLESRPVQARAGDVWYRTRKFLRRFWIPVAAATLALAGLATGIWLANRARVVAERRFAEVRQLSNELFDIEREVRRLPGSTKARQIIVDTSLKFLRRLGTDAQGDHDLALDLATAYMRVGRVQGVGITANLGQEENAEKNLRIAEGLLQSVLNAQPNNRIAFLRAAQVAHDRMVLAQNRRPNTEALPLARQSEEWLLKYLDSGKVDEIEKDQVVIVGMNVANWYVRQESAPDGLTLLRRTIEIARATNQPGQVGAAQIVLARALREAGDLEGALGAAREAEVLLEPAPGERRVNVRTFRLALATQGMILGEDNAVSLGRPKEAEILFARAFKIAAEMVEQDARESTSRLVFASDGIKLAGVLRHSDPRKAISIYEQVLRRLQEVGDHSIARRDEIRTLAALTYPLRQIGRTAEARQRLDTALARLRALQVYPAQKVQLGSDVEDVLRAMAEDEAGAGRIQKGIEIYQELLGLIEASKPKPESRLADAAALSNIYASLTALHRRAGHADTTGIEARRLALWRHWDTRLPNNAFVRRQLEAAQAH